MSPEWKESQSFFHYLVAEELDAHEGTWFDLFPPGYLQTFSFLE